MENLIIIFTGILFGGFSYLLKKGTAAQKEILKNLAKSIVETVALEMLEATGKEKFVHAALKFQSRLPKFLRIFITTKKVEKLIQHAYDESRDKLKRKSNKIKGLAVDTAMITANKIIKEAINADVDGNKDLVSNRQLLDINQKVEQNIDKIYAELTAKTNFKDKKER
jgi:hypothetical protein